MTKKAKIRNLIDKVAAATKLNFSEIAYAIGKSPASIYRWYAGINNPKKNTIIALAKLAGLQSVDYLGE